MLKDRTYFCKKKHTIFSEKGLSLLIFENCLNLCCILKKPHKYQTEFEQNDITNVRVVTPPFILITPSSEGQHYPPVGEHYPPKRQHQCQGGNTILPSNSTNSYLHMINIHNFWLQQDSTLWRGLQDPTHEVCIGQSFKVFSL